MEYLIKLPTIVVGLLIFIFAIEKHTIMLTKEKLKLAIDQFPEQFTVDELIEHLLVIEKIEKANNQSLKGEIISEEELDVEIAKWFE